MDLNKLLALVLIPSLIIYFFVLLIIARIRYSTFLNLVKRKESNYKENLGGLFVGNGGKFVYGFVEYWFRSPLPINYKSNDTETKNAIKKHDSIIRLFWISAVTFIPITILILNLTE
tara:strand:+ start:1520 stop:1870 length:351 start_codon:yes stop_codon:yes gene_type:complete